MMFTSVLLAILVSAVPTTDDTDNPDSAAPLKVTVGNMTFSGKAIKLTTGQSKATKSDSGAFECTIDGAAQLTFGSGGETDFAITAQNIVIISDGKSPLSISCTGTCNWKDSDYMCSADRLQIHFAKKVKLQLSGNATVQSGAGDARTTLAGESITFDDGKFNVSGVSGTGSLQRGK